MARYLVTGAAGFIGSHLVETLLERGETVVGLDNLSSGRLETLSFVETLGYSSRFTFIEGSILDFDTCGHAVRGCDYVLHHAALSSVPGSIANPVLYQHNNVTGTMTLLEASRQEGVKRFIFASSSSVYGDSPALPKEETMPLLPLSPYAVSKLTGELYCKLYTTVYGLPTVSLRYFNVFGPRQSPTSDYAAVIPRFITAFKKGEAPVIYGDGEQSRDFIYIGNVCDANIQACLVGEHVFGQVYNIGSGHACSINELVAVLKETMGVSLEPAFLPPRVGDIRDSVASIVAAGRDLFYSSSYPLLEGLRKTVKLF